MRTVFVTMNVFNKHRVQGTTFILFPYHVSYFLLINMILTYSSESHVVYNCIFWVSITFH